MAGSRTPGSGHVVSGQGPVKPRPRKIRFVNGVGRDGWLLTLQDRTNSPVSLCKYTRLEETGRHRGRTSYVVRDGPSSGKHISLSDAGAAKFIGKKPPTNTPVTIEVVYGAFDKAWFSKARNETLEQQFATLTVDGITVQVTMNSVWGTTFSPLAPAEYDVLVPDSPHAAKLTAFYRTANPDLKFDQVWFPIRFSDNSRFVHVGNLSDGCVTVIDDTRWAALHEAIVSHRDKTGRMVARLKITGTPQRVK